MADPAVTALTNLAPTVVAGGIAVGMTDRAFGPKKPRRKRKAQQEIELPPISKEKPLKERSKSKAKGLKTRRKTL